MAVVAGGAGAWWVLQHPIEVQPVPVVAVQPPPPPVVPDPPPPPVKPPEPPPPEVKDPEPVPPVVKPPPVKPVKLTPAMMAEVMKKNSPLVQQCVTKHLADLKEPEGKIVVTVTIELSGESKTPKLVSPSLPGSGLEACVVKEVKKFKFPRYVGPAPTFNVNFTYNKRGG